MKKKKALTTEKYRVVLEFETKPGESLSHGEIGDLIAWVRGTMDNGEYSEDVGFSSKLDGNPWVTTQ